MDDSVLEEALPKRHTKASLERLLGRPRFAYDVESINECINEPVWDLLSRGGKRWRPRFFELILRAYSHPEHSKLAAIVEILHNGTLIIDDIEDGSELRRGKPCIHRMYGTDVAINAGNAIYYIPFHLVTRSDLPEGKRLGLLETYVDEMIRISHGQGLDIWWHRTDKYPTEGQYLQMCAYKTGNLARMVAKMAGLLCDLPREKQEMLGRFGESLGTAFQIQDDLLNIVGDVKKYGKEIGGDITEGKKTLMVIYAAKRLQKREAAELKLILSAHTRSARKISRAIGLIRKSGAVEYSREVARELVSESWSEVGPIIPQCPEKAELKGLADFLVNREL